MAKIGVYSIKNIVTGRTYIGSSTNLAARLSGHRKLLRDAKHHCDDMIDDWKKYGAESFKFETIEIVEDKDMLLSREEFWIKEVISKDILCYNKRIQVRKINMSCVKVGRNYLPEMRSLISRNPQAAIILMLFIEHMDNANAISCTNSFMQQYFSCSKASITRQIRFLRENGFVSISKNGNFNVYTVNTKMFETINIRECA